MGLEWEGLRYLGGGSGGGGGGTGWIFFSFGGEERSAIVLERLIGRSPDNSRPQAFPVIQRMCLTWFWGRHRACWWQNLEPSPRALIQRQLVLLHASRPGMCSHSECASGEASLLRPCKVGPGKAPLPSIRKASHLPFNCSESCYKGSGALRGGRRPVMAWLNHCGVVNRKTEWKDPEDASWNTCPERKAETLQTLQEIPSRIKTVTSAGQAGIFLPLPLSLFLPGAKFLHSSTSDWSWVSPTDQPRAASGCVIRPLLAPPTHLQFSC